MSTNPYNGFYNNNGCTTNYKVSNIDLSNKIPVIYTGTFYTNGSANNYYDISFNCNAPPACFIFSSYLSSSSNAYTSGIAFCTLGWNKDSSGNYTNVSNLLDYNNHTYTSSLSYFAVNISTTTTTFSNGKFTVRILNTSSHTEGTYEWSILVLI